VGSSDLVRRFHLFTGSLPLVLLSPDAQATGCWEKFKKVGPQLQQRLESFPHVRVLGKVSEDSLLSFRLPRKWQPTRIESDFEPGLWVFPTFRPPVIFQFHLPRNLQNAVYAGAGDNHSVEDFWIAYDGTVFVGLCENRAEDILSWVAPMVRKYLQDELLKSVGDCQAAVIPPSPLYVEIDLLSQVASGAQSFERQDVDWDPQSHSLVVRNWRGSELTPNLLVESFYGRMRAPLHLFYDLEIDISLADELVRGILTSTAETYLDYEKSLDTAFWKLIPKWRTQRGLSRKIGRIQYSFCEHALSLTRVREAQGRLYRELGLNPLMRKSEEFFRSITEPEGLNYELYRNMLEHVRSHVLVLTQNKYLLYAALAGSLITLLGTVFGYFVHN